MLFGSIISRSRLRLKWKHKSCYLISFKYSSLLKDQRHQASDQNDYKFKIDQWRENVEKRIALEKQRLISIKTLHTTRYCYRNETAVYKTKYERGAHSPPEFADAEVNEESEDEEEIILLEIEKEMSKLIKDLEKAIQDDSKTHDERRRYLKKVKFLQNNIPI